MQDYLPLVSVLISSYNEEAHIAECIKSIKHQTYTNIEIIILDDASKDKTVEIIKQHLSTTDLLIVNSVNLKHHECFNKLLTLAKGEFIKFVMADDYLMPTSIEKSVQVLMLNSDVSLVAHGRVIVDYKSEKLFEILLKKKSFKLAGNEMFLKTLASGTNIIGEPNACLFRKKDIDSDYFWDLNIIGAGELALWYKILQKGNFYYIPEALCGFRISLKSASLVHAGKIAKHFLRFIKKIKLDGYYVPNNVYVRAFVNSYVKQELRRLVYIYIKLKIFFENLFNPKSNLASLK